MWITAMERDKADDWWRLESTHDLNVTKKTSWNAWCAGGDDSKAGLCEERWGGDNTPGVSSLNERHIWWKQPNATPPAAYLDEAAPNIPTVAANRNTLYLPNFCKTFNGNPVWVGECVSKKTRKKRGNNVSDILLFIVDNCILTGPDDRSDGI